MNTVDTIQVRRASGSKYSIGMVMLLALILSAFQFAPEKNTSSSSFSGVSALEFDGTNDRVIVPYSASFPTEVFTASAWVKLSRPNRRAAIIARGEDDNSWNLSWQLYVTNSGTFEIMLEDSGENNYCYPFNNCAPLGSCSITGDLFVGDDVWHHVAATRDSAGNLAMYVDGVSHATCTGTGVPSSNNFHDLSIGCTFGAIGPPPGGIEPPVWFLGGQIDEPAMWTTALSESEIADVYSNGVDVQSAGLAGYWDFEEGSGQIVQDLSPAGNHGYLGAIATSDSADPVWVNAQPTDLEDAFVPRGTTPRLEPNYPNPFGMTTSIEFNLTRPETVRLVVFDLLGRPVTTLADGQYGIGNHRVTFDGAALPAGTYFYRLETGEGRQTGTMWLMK